MLFYCIMSFRLSHLPPFCAIRLLIVFPFSSVSSRLAPAFNNRSAILILSLSIAISSGISLYSVLESYNPSGFAPFINR